MKKSGIIFLFLVLCLSGCNNSNVLPGAKISYLEKYHCWPYDVTVYSVENIKIDSLFYTYPLKRYFGNDTKYNISTWKKYDDLDWKKYDDSDTLIWSGMNKVLEQCDDNIELYMHIMKGEEIYYSGSYQYMKNREGKKERSYEKILFLDLKSNKLHIFKDVNKTSILVFCSY
jgi:hypothetical protein